MKMPIEFCPVCKQPHEVPEIQRDSKGVTYRKCIECKCGALLAVTVPIFKMTTSGFMFKNIRTKDNK